MPLNAHFWTIWPMLRGRAWPPAAPAFEPWSTSVATDLGPVQLTGRLAVRDPKRLVVLVHGLGGCTESGYLLRAARAAHSLGLSSLRFNMRGSDRQGGDLYHAGLTTDLATVIADQRLADFDQIYVLGFSLGGHLTLKYASEVDDPRVRAVAAICSPLSLETTVEHFDAPHRWLYRRYILSALKDLYRQVATRQNLATPLDVVLAVDRLREFDRLTVVPRFGFDSAAHYYATQSVGPRLDRLRIPALLLASTGDPMVTAISIRQGLATAPSAPNLRVVWVERGGHVGFPSGVDAGLGGSHHGGQNHGGKAIGEQVLWWLMSCSQPSSSQLNSPNLVC